MAFITKSSIQEVNDRIDTIAVITDYVNLEKRGGRWWGRCPFHAGGQEKTPSFKVDPDLKRYHCFGCNKNGSVIDFIMEMDKITYPEAVKTLARKMGVELVFEEGKAGAAEAAHSNKDELFDLYKRTTVLFQHFLFEKPEGKAALNYLKDRGISQEMTEQFKLGFSPQDRNFLYGFLKKKGYSDLFLSNSGLFSSRYNTMPMFSGRLMFPITDRQGRVAAFGGRAIPGILQRDGKEPPKYINSPETDIYKKSQILYAMDHALPLIRQNKTVLLAEGYIDVIALHQAGVSNAVAPLGTAFTGEQAALIHRWAEKAILFFDEDEAGQKAAYKAIITCRKNGLLCELININEDVLKETGHDKNNFKDPADILLKFGSNILKKIMNCTINDLEYLIKCGISLYKAKGGGKNRAAEFLFPYLEALDSEIERDDGIALISDAFMADRRAVQNDFKKWKIIQPKNGGYLQHSKQPDLSAAAAEQRLSMNFEIYLLTVVAVNMTLYPEFRSALEIKEIDDPAAKELFVVMEECYIHDENDINSLLDRIKNEQLRSFIATRGISEEFMGEADNDSGHGMPEASLEIPRKLMEDGIKEIKKKNLLKRLDQISAEIRNCERSASDLSSIDELLAEKKILDLQLRNLSS